MIRELNIENFAIIDSIHIEFNEGMSVLTGETGAGKSIIIDAIDQLLGARSSSSLIKHGQNKAYIEAILDYHEDFDTFFEEYHLPIEDIITLSKEISANGRTVCKINYKTVSNTILSKLGPSLIDIHSQFENHKLLDPRNDLTTLDRFSDANLTEFKNQYFENYHFYKELQKKYRTLYNQKDSLEQLDFYENQLAEINQFDFENESVDELEAEYENMKNFEKINISLSNFKQIFNGDQGIMDLMYESNNLLKIVDEHPDFKESVEKFNDLYYQLQDIKEEIIDQYDMLSFDEYRFNEVQEKLHIISKLKRKYGPDIEEIINKKQEIEENIDLLNNRDAVLADLTKQINQVEKVCMNIAKSIHQERVKTADELKTKIDEQLHSLYMVHANFEVKITTGELNSNGYDEVAFLIATNKGSELEPIGKIVSGGELSRIMLAMKTILLQKDQVETIIFDEVDTGVSGKVADAIGSKMKLLSKDKQVLCITHLPQVASYANYHLYISKSTNDTTTSSNIELLDLEQRIEEIAKMLSGENISQAAKEQARNLINEKA